MYTRRIVFISFALACVFSGTVALAAPMQCQPGTMAEYLLLNMGCTLGGFTAMSFAFQASQPGEQQPGQILVNPVITATGFTLQIRGAFSGPVQGSFTYLFSYFLDPPPIIREEVDLDPAGTVALQTVLCAVNTVPCPNANTIATLNTSTQNTVTFTTLNNLSLLGIQNTLTLTGSTATSMGFDNVTSIDAPEPIAFLLTGAGLLALFAFRSRLKFR